MDYDKLGREDVFELLVGIHKSAKGCKFTASQIARKYGCSRAYIHEIIKGFIRHGLLTCDNVNSHTKFYSSKLNVFNPRFHTFCTHAPYDSSRVNKCRIDTLKKYNWTEIQKKRVFGELLGDGHISKRYHFRLTSISKEHTLFLKSKLPVDLFSKSVPHEYIPKNKNWKPTYTLSSRLCKFFYYMRHKWYPLGIKVIPNDLCLDPTICYHWYIGDGYLNKKHNYIVLSTDCFLRDDVDFLVSQLIKNEIDARRTLSGRGASTISIKKADKFLEWINPNEISDYNYKWAVKSL